jgi:epoxyqueuosine reductase QueG
MEKLLMSADGRYFSVITTLPLTPDPVITEERCLFKRDVSCGLCVKRCPANALTEEGFDRFRCLERCLVNDALYPGADVCGKCAVSLPCSHEIP